MPADNNDDGGNRAVDGQVENKENEENDRDESEDGSEDGSDLADLAGNLRVDQQRQVSSSVGCLCGICMSVVHAPASYACAACGQPTAVLSAMKRCVVTPCETIMLCERCFIPLPWM